MERTLSHEVPRARNLTMMGQLAVPPPLPLPLLDDEIHSLHAAAITAELDRSTLLAGIDPRLVATMPFESSRAAQLLGDLHRLNALSAVRGGAVPVRTWIQNAVSLASARSEGNTFKITLRIVDQRMLAARSGTARAAETTDAEDRPVRAFVSAVEADARFVEALEKHLAPLVGAEQLVLWHRGRVRGGGDARSESEDHLGRSDLVMLMVSADYLADGETIGEAARALELAGRGARVVPIIARPCDWRSSPFATLMPLPRSGRPIGSRGRFDTAHAEIAREIRLIVDELRRHAAAVGGFSREVRHV